MPEKEFSALPFITRKMLAFEGGTIFDLEVVTASDAIAVLEITGMTREGPFKYAFQTNGLSAAQTTIFRIPDVPIFLTVKTDGIASITNNFYAMVYLRASETRIQLLCQGNLGQLHGINFPGQVNVSPLQARGTPAYTESAVPAAGANATMTVPAGQYWVPNRAHVTLVSAVAAANRVVRLQYQDTESRVLNILPAALQTASLTVKYNWFIGAAMRSDADSLDQNAPLPAGVLLNPGSIVKTIVKNIQAADSLTFLKVYYDIYFSA